jgi:dihydropteroate synthase
MGSSKILLGEKLTLDLKRTSIMGILNITPDSFADGGRFIDIETAINHAKEMQDQGADIIDIGGESTRPGSEPLSEDEELARVLPVIKKLVGTLKIPISVDTYKPRVADECLQAGAHIINDITGLTNSAMIDVISEYNVPVVIMHMRGTPKHMQENPTYSNVVNEVKDFLKDRVNVAHKAGIHDVIVDPGIGFGKTLDHNLQLLKNLKEFTTLGCPLLVGPSRKSFIGKLTGLSVEQRLEGTLAAVSVSVMNGANIVRVHDVAACKQAVQVADAIRGV